MYLPVPKCHVSTRMVHNWYLLRPPMVNATCYERLLPHLMPSRSMHFQLLSEVGKTAMFGSLTSRGKLTSGDMAYIKTLECKYRDLRCLHNASKRAVLSDFVHHIAVPLGLVQMWYRCLGVVSCTFPRCQPWLLCKEEA